MGKRKPQAPKQPAGKTVPSKGRIAATLPGSGNSDQRISWRFQHFDWDGSWPFYDLVDFREVEAALRQFETMTINGIFHSGSGKGKKYEVARIPCRDALERLEALKLSDQDEIHRLDLGGKKRLYGFLVGNVFHIVFWDPEHQIWPSPKKHT